MISYHKQFISRTVYKFFWLPTKLYVKDGIGSTVTVWMQTVKVEQFWCDNLWPLPPRWVSCWLVRDDK